jgi:hypothetical protein
VKLEETLAQRKETTGEFKDVAAVCQAIKDVMRDAPKWNGMQLMCCEALDMIAHKMARILCGDPEHADAWHDIQGYAKLVEDRLTGGFDATAEAIRRAHEQRHQLDTLRAKVLEQWETSKAADGAGVTGSPPAKHGIKAGERGCYTWPSSSRRVGATVALVHRDYTLDLVLDEGWMIFGVEASSFGVPNTYGPLSLLPGFNDNAGTIGFNRWAPKNPGDTVVASKAPA